MVSLGSSPTLNIAVVAVALLIYLLELNLESFYIFSPPALHELAQRAISVHGNNTRGIVSYIVEDLYVKLGSSINLDEEWIFNNAGGAMGAMYIVHASITEYLIVFGMDQLGILAA